MTLIHSRQHALAVLLVLGSVHTAVAASQRSAASVPQWRRHIVEIVDSTYTGNPFEVIADATFTHTTSGQALTLPAYYAGGDAWRIGFMPTEIGFWNWVVSSADPDLDGASGTVECTASGLPGLLRQGPEHPDKWTLGEGQFIVPVALRMELFFEPAPLAVFLTACDFLRDDVGGHLYETRLTDENGWYGGGRTDWIFQGDWSQHVFDLAQFDQMEERMEALTERGLGCHVMFYSDDLGAPGWGGQSATEGLVIRYVTARLSGYPMVVFSVGIDVPEYRSQADVDWFGQTLRALDPYGHPVSSRHGGGSGGIVMSGQTFDSNGLRTADTPAMIAASASPDTPVSFDDAWGENRPSHPDKNHTPEDIRRAFWKCVIAGGAGGLVRGTGDGLPGDGYFSIHTVAQDLESEQWLSLVSPFVKDQLGDGFATMGSAPELVSGSAYCAADSSRTTILYLVTGANDTYDPRTGPFTAQLSGVSGEWDATWFDPRTGSQTDAGFVPQGTAVPYVPLTSDDWILLLKTPTNSTGVRSGSGTLLSLESRPNPFRDRTHILFEVSGQGAARLGVYDPAGRLVRTLIDGNLPAGTHAVVWEGERAGGRRVAPGTYFCRLETPRGSASRKLLIVR